MRARDYADLAALEDDFWWFVGMRAIAAALLDPLCGPGRRLVLDAGCGTGGNLAWLVRYAGDGAVVGLDLISTALALCHRHGPRRLVQGSVVALPFADRTVDLLTSFDVLGHLPRVHDAGRAVREMCRVLRPGGIAFVRVAAYRWLRSDHDDALGTYTRYSLGELTRIIERGGLRVRRATYAASLLLPIAAVRRLVGKRLRLAAGGSDVRPLPPALRGLNRALTAELRAEAMFLRQPRATLPAGLSAICVAERPRR